MRHVGICAIAFAFFAFALPVAHAGECDNTAWVPQTEECLWFGVKTRLDIMQRGLDLAFKQAHLPAFYKLVVVRKGRNGRESDSYVSPNEPAGMDREWFTNFYAYVTLDYLAEHDQYAALIRAGTARYCESHYLHYPMPLPEKSRTRREEIERCVYQTMVITDSEQHYFTALQKEIELGDEYLAEFKGLPYVTLRDTVRKRYGFLR